MVRKHMKKYASIDNEKREKLFADERQNYKDIIPELKKIHDLEKDLWNFLDKEDNKKPFLEILNQWQTYESAGESVTIPTHSRLYRSEQIPPSPDISLYAIKKSELEYTIIVSSKSDQVLTELDPITFPLDATLDNVLNDIAIIDVPANARNDRIETKGRLLYRALFHKHLQDVYWK